MISIISHIIELRLYVVFNGWFVTYAAEEYTSITVCRFGDYVAVTIISWFLKRGHIFEGLQE